MSRYSTVKPNSLWWTLEALVKLLAPITLMPNNVCDRIPENLCFRLSLLAGFSFHTCNVSQYDGVKSRYKECLMGENCPWIRRAGSTEMKQLRWQSHSLGVCASIYQFAPHRYMANVLSERSTCPVLSYFKQYFSFSITLEKIWNFKHEKLCFHSLAPAFEKNCRKIFDVNRQGLLFNVNR